MTNHTTKRRRSSQPAPKPAPKPAPAPAPAPAPSAAHARLTHIISAMVDIEANLGDAAHWLADAHRIARDACQPPSRQAISGHEHALGEAVYQCGQALLAAGIDTRELVRWAHQDAAAGRGTK